MAKARPLLLLLFLFSTISAQINFGGGGSRTPSTSTGSQKPSPSSPSGSRPSSGSSIQFSSEAQSAKEVVQGLQSKRQTLATVLKSQGVTPAVDVNIRGTLGTRRLGDQCTTPQRTAGTCQYIFARQCRWALFIIIYVSLAVLKLFISSARTKEKPKTGSKSIQIFLPGRF